jgi:hypothetical protein
LQRGCVRVALDLVGSRGVAAPKEALSGLWVVKSLSEAFVGCKRVAKGLQRGCAWQAQAGPISPIPPRLLQISKQAQKGPIPSVPPYPVYPTIPLHLWGRLKRPYSIYPALSRLSHYPVAPLEGPIPSIPPYPLCPANPFATRGPRRT